MRLFLGAFRTFPVESLYSKAYKPPLKFRFTKLGLQYYSKLKSQPSNQGYDCTFNPKQQNLFEQREKTIKTFSLWMKHILEDTDISLTNIHNTIQLSSSPWLLKQPAVILDLNKLPKNKTHPTKRNKTTFRRDIPITYIFSWMAPKATMEPDLEQFSTRRLWKNTSQKRPPYFLLKSVQ